MHTCPVAVVIAVVIAVAVAVAVVEGEGAVQCSEVLLHYDLRHSVKRRSERQRETEIVHSAYMKSNGVRMLVQDSTEIGAPSIRTSCMV